MLTGFIVYKIIFAILFHRDNKRKYTKRFTKKINFPILKEIILKMMFASFVFDCINNISRFFMIFELVKLNYSAVEAATISSLIASSLSYLVINIILKYIRLFGSKKR